MTMFERSPQGGQDIYGALTDPTAAPLPDNVKEDLRTRKLAKRRGVMTVGFLLASAVLSVIMYSDAADCSTWSEEAPPFDTVTASRYRFPGLLLLTLATHLAAAFYPVAVARKPRPSFLHVAGFYLILQAICLASIVCTVWAGCKEYPLSRSASSVLVFVLFPPMFVVFQYSIVKKVEALNIDASEHTLSTVSLRRAYNMMVNPVTIVIGVVSSVVSLNVMSVQVMNAIVYSDVVFLFGISCIFIVFTAQACKAMLAVWRLLKEASVAPEVKKLLSKHLMVHCTATFAANITTMLFFIAAGLTAWDRSLEWTLFSFFGLDCTFKLICALALSGLVGAVFRKNGGVALLEDETGLVHTSLSPTGPQGVEEQLAAAGYAAQEALDASPKDWEDTEAADMIKGLVVDDLDL